MKTATQEVIAKMQEAKENFPNIGFDDEFIRGFNKAFQMAIFITEKIGLPKEEEQITTAYKEGWMNPAKFRQHGSEYYYKNLFGDSNSIRYKCITIMKKVINTLEKSIELAKEFKVNSYTIVKDGFVINVKIK